MSISLSSSGEQPAPIPVTTDSSDANEEQDKPVRQVMAIGPQTPTNYYKDRNSGSFGSSTGKKKARKKKKKRRKRRENGHHHADSPKSDRKSGRISKRSAKTRSAISVAPADGPIVQYIPPFYVEGGGLSEEDLAELPPVIESEILDDVFDIYGKDNDHLYYKEAFADQEHWHFLNQDVEDVGPMLVSVVHSGDIYVGMKRTKMGTQRLHSNVDQVEVAAYRKLLKLGPDPRSILLALDPGLAPIAKSLRQIANTPDTQRQILDMEERQSIKGFKFGVIYARDGQTREDDYFCNTDTSAQFEEFLDFLGDRVQLHGFDGFAGGLDTKNDSTGMDSIHTLFREQPVMFHVSTMLPYNDKETQQLERKRHIGNDLVVIMFQEGSGLYRPQSLSSRMIHSVILVRPTRLPEHPGETYYRMSVIRKDQTPPFAPILPNVSVHKKGPAFREILFCKLLNGERAAYAAPILSDKMERTRNALLTHLCESLST